MESVTVYDLRKIIDSERFIAGNAVGNQGVAYVGYTAILLFIDIIDRNCFLTQHSDIWTLNKLSSLCYANVFKGSRFQRLTIVSIPYFFWHG